ncbi:serine hydrolase domain-containing protein [Fretibacter rubidus]|uniref:serine hydrolase domain-containing protein n=1 Tax=Fretibacter rubidus TaxID=570162 RepID=UPI00352A407E
MTLFSRLLISATVTAGFVVSPAVHAEDKAVATPATATAPAPSKIDLKAIDRRIAKLMQRDDMVGLSVAIIENGEIISAKGYGETIKGSRQMVTADTVFRWASVSKSVAAATAILLVKDDYFGLSSPVVAHAPSVKLPPSDHMITLEDLLSHRTGIVRNAYDVKIEDGRDPKVIRTSLQGLSHLCEPGTCHGYQNVLFDAVSEMTETATGIPYKAVVNERIFEPLGMSTASTTLEGLSRSKSWARPHNRRGAMISSVKPTYYRVPAAAGVNSSITDMAKWTLAQMDGGQGGLPADVANEIHTARVQTPRENRRMRRHYSALSDAHYALGWRSYNMEGHRVVGHRGAVEGYRSAVLFDPEHKTGIAMMWNSSSSRPVGLQLELFDQVHDRPRRDWMRLAR